MLWRASQAKQRLLALECANAVQNSQPSHLPLEYGFDPEYLDEPSCCLLTTVVSVFKRDENMFSIGLDDGRGIDVEGNMDEDEDDEETKGDDVLLLPDQFEKAIHC